MNDGSEKVNKLRLDVEIELDDGRRMLGTLFVSPQKRLTDMLNEDRRFVPFETVDGRFLVLQKSCIRTVAPLSQEKKGYEGNNPYQILGVGDDASLEEVKKAYHALCAEYHPDRIRGAGISEELVDLANVRMARINDAYRRITDDRSQAAAAGE